MSDMKCPFCQQELDYDDLLCSCINEYCEESFDMVGTELLWQKVIDLKQELDCTRKALDVALDWLGQVATPAKCDDELCREFTKRKLTEIKTALEQKDIK